MMTQKQVLQVLVKFAHKGLTMQKHENIFSPGYFYVAYCLWNLILLWLSVSVTAAIPSFHASGFDSEGGFSDFQSQLLNLLSFQ